MPRCPTLLVAGTHSGSGKTSLTLALTRALTRRGLRVQTFKVGPDFLDPTYLALASGRPCYNLDGWMAGQDHVRNLFEQASADADCALIEGVMGLFDGADPANDEGSTAEIARWLSAPVLLVANVHGMGRSIAALVKGFTTFAADLRFAGIAANHCGSERHAVWLADSLRAADLPPLVGAIPRGAFPELAHRHLGLVTADRGQLSEALLDDLATALERHLSVEELFPELLLRQTNGLIIVMPDTPELIPGPASRRRPGESRIGARDRPRKPAIDRTPASAGVTNKEGLPYTKAGVIHPPPDLPRAALDSVKTGTSDEPSAVTPSAQRVESACAPTRHRIGVARDAAFHFYYQALFDALAAAGCEPAFFSPLTDSRLPAGISGLYLGGGYPEAHAGTLAANGEMLAAIRTYAVTGKPLYAECGGLMYLSEGLIADSRFHPFLGILPARTRMLAGRKALGYVEVTLTADSLWGQSGDVARGHEFHYSELIGDPTADPSWQKVYALSRRRDIVEAEGFQKGAILASYTHLYYAAHPAAIDHFINRLGGTP